MKTFMGLLVSMIVLLACSKPIEGEKIDSPVSFACAYNPAIIHVDEDNLHICGVIDFEFVEEAERYFDENSIRKIILSSAGGVSSEAIEFAEQLNAKSIALEVHGVCLSACASFLLMLTDQVLVEEGALVGFHQTAFAQLGMMNRLLRTPPEDRPVRKIDLDRLKVQSFSETAAFSRAGVDVSALSEPFEMLGVRCINGVSVVDGAQYDKFDANARWLFSVPEREKINSWRKTDIVGWWPTDQRDLNLAAKAHFDNPSKFLLFRFYTQNDLNQKTRTNEYALCSG